MRATRSLPAPAPCTTYRPMADGTLAIVAVEIRDPLRFVSEYEAEMQVFHFVVLCHQETGEDFCIGNARSRIHADRMIEAHRVSHPEHYGYCIETL